MKQSEDTKVAVLGEPLSIEEAARLIGCSAWTIRQKLIPQGLPCLKSSEPSGRWIFYENQLVAWILKKQKTKEER